MLEFLHDYLQGLWREGHSEEADLKQWQDFVKTVEEDRQRE